MTTRQGVLVEAGARPDFWKRLRAYRVKQLRPCRGPWALIECTTLSDMTDSVRLAENLSREFDTRGIAFVVQTNVDVHEFHAFEDGSLIRRLVYSREQGGWITQEGSPQFWEAAYFFGPEALRKEGEWPDMLESGVSADDLARYETARSSRDGDSILELLRPSSVTPLLRWLGSFGVGSGTEPHGVWAGRSLWSWLFR